MIISRGLQIRHEDQIQMFDYSAYVYPIGLMPDNQVFYFNVENIDKVVFEGYSDEEEIKFKEAYNKWLAENKDKIVKGKVTDPLPEK
jgi:hypothetical protein